MVNEDVVMRDEEDKGSTSNLPWLVFEKPVVLTLTAIIAVLILFYGVIKLKRAIQVETSSISLFTAPSLTLATYTEKEDDEAAVWSQKNISNFLNKDKPRSSCAENCRTFPRRLWNLYIDAFIVPGYREEWGKYQAWSYRSPLREKHVKGKKGKKDKKKIDQALLQEYETEEQKERRLLEDPVSYRTIKKSKSKSKMSVQTKTIPKPVLHDHEECQRVQINVGGLVYETQLKTLNRYPDTLLGNPLQRLKYYNPITQEYFFDRNRLSFEAILYFYQTGGRFRRPDYIAADIMLDDAKFYGLPQGVIHQFLIDEGLTYATQPDEILPKNMLMRKVWLLFDYPESSLQGHVVAIISISSIIISITTFCIETESDFSADADAESDTIADPFYLVETVCSVWFTVEFLVRLISSPDKIIFIKTMMNIFDLVAILPYFVQLLTPPAETDNGKPVSNAASSTINLIRVIKLFRVVRIFKLSRHSNGLKILGKTLKASMNELMLLVMFVMIGAIIFSSFMYFAEYGENPKSFPSIPAGIWWALITITTVGYGDAVPITVMGKLVGAVCAVAGVLAIALPVPVIVSNFNYFYNQTLGEQDLSWLKIKHVPACPFRPMDVCKGCNVHEGYGYKTLKKNMSKSKRTLAIPEPMYSSDDQFEELKNRVIIKEGIDPSALRKIQEPSNPPIQSTPRKSKKSTELVNSLVRKSSL